MLKFDTAEIIVNLTLHDVLAGLVSCEKQSIFHRSHGAKSGRSRFSEQYMSWPSTPYSNPFPGVFYAVRMNWLLLGNRGPRYSRLEISRGRHYAIPGLGWSAVTVGYCLEDDEINWHQRHRGRAY